MTQNHHVCCPNCGNSNARRRYFTRTDAKQCQGEWVNQVECPACDYLMVTCATDGRVVEAYSSGLFAPNYRFQPRSRRLTLRA